jgi:NADPH:quinone reductase-like Zn-dependent oxidoreductase
VAGPGEAVIRVRACALNHLDLWQRRGIERVSIPFPHISGADVAGEVASAPGGEYGVGRRVMLQPGLSCGRCAACLDGRDNECPAYDVLGYRSDGGYAEYVKVPVQNLIAIPDAIGFVEAAAFPLAFLTAWHMLITRAKLRAGEDVLVIGAGSGVGQAAIQIAWRHGARVFATAGSDDKLVKARQLGAYEVVNHATQDVPTAIKSFTGGRGVDVVVEHVGTATWDRSLRCLVRAGRLAPPPDMTRNSTSDSCLGANSRCSAPTWAARANCYGRRSSSFQANCGRSWTRPSRCPRPPRRSAASNPGNISARSSSSHKTARLCRTSSP